MKILIITDGNNELGLGHVYQSLTLADLLKNKLGKDVQINFLTKSAEKICNFIELRGYNVETLKTDDLIFENLKYNKPDRIIFDKLDVSPDLVKKIKDLLGTKLVIFTNLTDASLYADVTVLADINFKNIVKRDSDSGRTEFLGPKFWLLRPDFYALKNVKKVLSPVVRDIMLIFGGSDPSNMSSLVLNELLQIPLEFNITLVLGSSFNHYEELNAVLVKKKLSKSHVTIVENMTNVAEVMHKSHVVFASPGLSFFEALVVGTPVIGFYQNEQQRQEYVEVLPIMGIAELYKLPLIINNKSFLFPNDSRVKSMEIGEGKDEIISEILK